MQQKRIKAFHVDLFIPRIIIVLAILFPGNSLAQLTPVDLKSQQLLMQMGAAYLNVASQNQRDLDSGLELAAGRNHLNRMFVIGENYEGILLNPENRWVAKGNIEGAKHQASVSKGLVRIQLLNLIGAYYVFQSGSRKNHLDSALFYLTIAKKESESMGDHKLLSQTLRYLGKVYLELKDFPLAASTFTQCMGLSAKLDDRQGQAMTLTYWAAYTPFQPVSIQERIDHLKQALDLYRQTGDKHDQILVLTYLGYLSFAAGKMAESKQDFINALNIEKSIGFPFTQYTTDLLSFIDGTLANHEEQLRYAIDGISTAEATRDSVALAYFYGRRSVADFGYRDYDTVGMLEWNQKALSEFIRLGGEPGMYLQVFDIANAFIKKGMEQKAIRLVQDILKKFPPQSPIERQNAYLTLGLAYSGVKNFPMAERYFLAAENTQNEAMKIRGKLMGFTLYYHIGRFYFDAHEYNKSQTAYKTALTYPTNESEFLLYQTMTHDLAIIDSANGQFESAFNHLNLFNNIRDTTIAKISSKEVNEMRVRMEADKKDNNIKLLNQQAQIQQAEIRQNRLTRNVVIAGAALLLVFLCYLFYQFRAKQKINHKLKGLVEEKEFLLKEIHHRVKNNLQIVISLLNTQSKFLDNERALAAISQSRHRMQAMSLIHQKLYQSENLTYVGMPEYIRELINYIRNSFPTGSKIRFDLEIDPIDLDISQAIPIGLILNEAITNCLKHAFENQEDCFIKIQMKRREKNHIYLEIADNGKGLSPDQNNTFAESMGMRLIRGLIEQIGGKLTIRNENGLVLSTTFPLEPVLKAVAV